MVAALAPVIGPSPLLKPKPSIYICRESHTQENEKKISETLERLDNFVASGKAFVFREGTGSKFSLDRNISGSATFAVTEFIRLARASARAPRSEVPNDDIEVRDAEMKWIFMFAKDKRLQHFWTTRDRVQNTDNVSRALDFFVDKGGSDEDFQTLNAVVWVARGEPALLECAKFLAKQCTAEAVKETAKDKKSAELTINFKVAERVIQKPLDKKTFEDFVSEIAIRWRNHDWLEIISSAYESATTQTAMYVFCNHSHATGLKEELLKKYPDIDLHVEDAHLLFEL